MITRIWGHDIRKTTTLIWGPDIREMITDKENSGLITDLLRSIVHHQVAFIYPDSGCRMSESTIGTEDTIGRERTIGTGIPDLQGVTIHGLSIVISMSELNILSSVVVVDGKTRAAE